MDTGKALEIVHILATRYFEDKGESYIDGQHAHSQEALDTVADFITNNFAEDAPEPVPPTNYVEQLADAICARVKQQLEQERIVVMPLCETEHVGLRPGVLYQFFAVANCARCTRLAAPYREEQNADSKSV